MLPIVLIHGFPFDGSMWRAQEEFLRSPPPQGGGYRVLAPDLPGFGPRSQTPAPDPAIASMEGFAGEIHRLIAREGGKAIVGGLSMGGYVLLALLRLYPQDVAAAMLIDTRAQADTPEVRANRLKSIDDVKANGTGTLMEGLMGRLVAKTAATTAMDQVRANMARQSPQAVIAAQSAMSRRRDQMDLLPQIAIPALIIVGTEDVITPPQAARDMHDRIPHSRLVEIPGAGHMSPLEKPAAVNEAIKAFLDSIPGT
jgi:pimeloyl-ACP methyl ester carboxylesterase